MNRTRILLSTFCIAFLFQNADSQVIGGDNIYEFLNLSPSARITALGHHLISVQDDDVNLAFQNPAALNLDMHHQISFSHNFFPADIGHSHVAFGQHIEKWQTTFHLNLQAFSYGDFNATDDVGNIIGTFDAAEQAITIGAGRKLYERVTLGANVRLVTSRFESYNSTGLTGDFAAMYHDTASNFSLTLAFKNFGRQLSTYTPDNREPMPFEMQAGLSKRLKYLPFRFSIIYRYLDKWNITYDDPNSEEDTFFGSVESGGDNNFVDNLARHFVFSGEFLFGAKDNFRVRVGYNHLRRKELTVRNLRSLTGFSMGVGLKINRFRIDYGRSITHIGSGLNHLSISTNLKEFTKYRRR